MSTNEVINGWERNPDFFVFIAIIALIYSGMIIIIINMVCTVQVGVMFSKQF